MIVPPIKALEAGSHLRLGLPRTIQPMREADRVAARKAAEERAQSNAKTSRDLAAERDEHAELAPRLKPAVRAALRAEKRRNYEDVVQVHGVVDGWFRSDHKYFGAFELFSVELPLPP